jgi:hypothetical protein
VGEYVFARKVQSAQPVPKPHPVQGLPAAASPRAVVAPARHSVAALTDDEAVQRMCDGCTAEAERRDLVVQRVIQRYDECEPSNHYTDRYHRYAQRKYVQRFGRGSPEFSLTDANGNWNFIDIADETDREVYEIKSANQGAVTAAAEATYYRNLLNTAGVGCNPRNWTLGQTIDPFTTEGSGERVNYTSPRDGVILYDVELIDVTESEMDSGSDSDSDSS